MKLTAKFNVVPGSVFAAGYIGPMARILVNKASGKAQDVRELYRMLAEDIPGKEQRQALLCSSQTRHRPRQPSTTGETSTT